MTLLDSIANDKIPVTPATTASSSIVKDIPDLERPSDGSQKSVRKQRSNIEIEIEIVPARLQEKRHASTASTALFSAIQLAFAKIL